MYEFEDYKDTANLAMYAGNRSAVLVHNLTDLQWVEVSHSITDNCLEIVLNATGSNVPNALFMNTSDAYISFRVLTVIH